VKTFLLSILIASLSALSASACSACFGKSDSPMAQGMNWGIFSLLAVIVPVLGGVAGFFVFLSKRSAALQAATFVSPVSAESVSSEPELVTARD